MDEYEKKSSINTKAESREPWDIYVSQGCKFRQVISHCLKMLEDKKDSNKIVLTGVGAQINKAISIAEIVKRKHKTLHQSIDISYTTVEDQWAPKDPSKGLDGLKVTRHLPTISIKLTSVASLEESVEQLGVEDVAMVEKEKENQLTGDLMLSLREMLNPNGQEEKPKKQQRKRKKKPTEPNS